MKITGPGGNGYKIPEPADNQGPKKTDKSQFDLGVEKSAGQSTPSTAKTEGQKTAELRKVLKGVVAEDDSGMKEATDKIVDWVLKDAFGDDLVKQQGADNLRSAIREQLLADPNEAARLRRILDQI